MVWQQLHFRAAVVGAPASAEFPSPRMATRSFPPCAKAAWRGVHFGDTQFQPRRADLLWIAKIGYLHDPLRLSSIPPFMEPLLVFVVVFPLVRVPRWAGRHEVQGG